MGKRRAPKTPKAFVKEYAKLGSVKAVAREHSLTWHRVRKLYLEAVNTGLMDAQQVGRKSKDETKRPEPKFDGTVYTRPVLEFPLPAKGKVRRHIFTCAQNNTTVHGDVWGNLLALAKHLGAEVHVSRFTYIKSGLGARGDKALWVKKEDSIGSNVEKLDWAPELEGHFLDERVKVAPGLIWCGEINILPTAVRPLSGLLSYTGRSSGIFPHVKLALESVSNGKYEPTKLCYTTGTVTKRNYIQRKAGLKGEFHHVYGGLLVEVDSDGNWFCRQLNADSSGTIHDLDIAVSDGVVSEGHALEAITWGDVHVADLDRTVADACWAEGGMLDTLRPKYQFMHDVLDFRSRSHHDVKNPHIIFMKHIDGSENVRDEVEAVGRFLEASSRPWCTTVVVNSNHHNHLGRWLRDEDGRKDPVNVEFWLECNRLAYAALAAKKLPNYLEIGLEAVGFDHPQVEMLGEDESFVVCPEAGGGVDCGHHGHLGPGGGRGTTRNLAAMGNKINKGHSHQAQIVDGVYSVGTCSNLSPHWAKGPNAWSHSHVLTYSNGKRSVITLWKGKWRA